MLRPSFLLAAACVISACAAANSVSQTKQSIDALPEGARYRLGSLRWRHATGVVFVAVTPDSKSVLTASNDHIIRLWDRATGTEIRRFESSSVGKAFRPRSWRYYRGYDREDVGWSSFSISSDGKTLAAALPNNVIQIWDVKTGREIRQLNRDTGLIFSIRFSTSGKILAIREMEQELTLFDVDTGNVRSIKNDPKDGRVGPGCKAGIVFSPDDAMIANGRMGSDQRNFNTFVQLLNPKTGAELMRWDTDMKNPAAIVFAPKGDVVAYSAGEVIHLRESATGKEIRQIKTPAPVTALVFSADAKVLVSKALDQQIRLYGADSGELIHEWGVKAAFAEILRTRASESCDLTLSADGKIIAWGDGQTVRQFDAESGMDLAPPGGHRAAVTAITVTADGKTLISYGEDNILRQWDLAMGKQLGELIAPLGTTLAAIAPDGRTAACANGDGTIRLVNLTTGKELRKFAGHGPTNPNSANETADLVFSLDGKLLASQGSFDDTIRLFDAVRGTELRQIKIQAAGKPDPSIGGIFYGFRVDGGQGMAFSADGQTFAVHVKELPSRDFFPSRSQLRRWDVVTGKELPLIELPKGCFATEVAYSPDGRLLAVVYEDQTISLFEVATGLERARLGTPQPKQLGEIWTYHRRSDPVPVKTLVFSPDGRRLLVRSPSDVLRVWDVHAAEEIGQFKGHDGAVLAAAFTPNGKRVVSAGNDTTILVWGTLRLKNRPTAPLALKATALDSLWDDLLSEDADKAFNSIQKLSASPDAVPFLKIRIRPAQGNSQKVAKWIADLDNSDFRIRNAAGKELQAMGQIALPALRAARDSASIEARRRIEALLEKLAPLQLATEDRRLVRSIEILERAETADARQLLQALAKGHPDALATRQARSALDRLQNKLAP